MATEVSPIPHSYYVILTFFLLHNTYVSLVLSGPLCLPLQKKMWKRCHETYEASLESCHAIPPCSLGIFVLRTQLQSVEKLEAAMQKGHMQRPSVHALANGTSQHHHRWHTWKHLQIILSHNHHSSLPDKVPGSWKRNKPFLCLGSPRLHSVLMIQWDLQNSENPLYL